MPRPVEFKEEEVLDRAMRAFWQEGYQGTSVAKLVDATKLQPGSIYAAFHSKEGLFLATLDYYGELSTKKLKEAMEQSESPLRGIRDYFQGLADRSTSAEANKSCYLVNSVLEIARNHQTALERINYHFQEIEGLFRSALERAQHLGELPMERIPENIAAFLITGIWGLRVLGATNPDRKRAHVVVHEILQHLE